MSKDWMSAMDAEAAGGIGVEGVGAREECSLAGGLECGARRGREVRRKWSGWGGEGRGDEQGRTERRRAVGRGVGGVDRGWSGGCEGWTARWGRVRAVRVCGGRGAPVMSTTHPRWRRFPASTLSATTASIASTTAWTDDDHDTMHSPAPAAAADRDAPSFLLSPVHAPAPVLAFSPAPEKHKPSTTGTATTTTASSSLLPPPAVASNASHGPSSAAAAARAERATRAPKKSARIALVPTLRVYWANLRRRLGTGTSPSTSSVFDDSAPSTSATPPPTAHAHSTPQSRAHLAGAKTPAAAGTLQQQRQQQLLEAEDDDVVDEVVVDRNWSEEIRSSVSQSDAGGLPDRHPGATHVANGNGHGPWGGASTDRDSVAHAEGLWASCRLLIVLRWRIWPAVLDFFSLRFPDKKAEAQYWRENWFMRKVRRRWRPATLDRCRGLG